jgi:hypothetical protein
MENKLQKPDGTGTHPKKNKATYMDASVDIVINQTRMLAARPSA